MSAFLDWVGKDNILYRLMKTNCKVQATIHINELDIFDLKCTASM
jgi:hypothetical protein